LAEGVIHRSWPGLKTMAGYGLRPSRFTKLLRDARKHNPAFELRQNNPTGKSLLIFGNAVKSLAQKYSA
jgi:hypothetical protein